MMAVGPKHLIRLSVCGKRRQHRGAVLVLIMVVGVLVFMLGLSTIEAGRLSRVFAIRDATQLKARSAADAGMGMAWFQMDKKLAEESVWNNSTLPEASGIAMPASGASYTYTVSGDPSAGFAIHATGTYQNRLRQVRAHLHVGSYWQGISMQQDITLRSSTGFDVMGPGTLEDFALSTNATKPGSIELKLGVRFPGDVVCGPCDNPEAVVTGWGEIEGEIYAASKPIIFNSVLAPTGFASGGAIADSATIVGGDWKYSDIHIPNGKVLSITAPTRIYVTGNVILDNSAQIIVGPSARLELYLGGDLVDRNSAGIMNQSGDATGMLIFGLPSCTHIELKATSDFYGAIYAPEADIVVKNGGNFIGAVVGKSFDLMNSGQFIFDTRLMTLAIDHPAATFDLADWEEN